MSGKTPNDQESPPIIYDDIVNTFRQKPKNDEPKPPHVHLIKESGPQRLLPEESSIVKLLSRLSELECMINQNTIGIYVLSTIAILLALIAIAIAIL